MARRPRIVVEGGLYHVYNRVSSGGPIFADPNEAIEFIEIVRDQTRQVRRRTVGIADSKSPWRQMM